MSLPVAREVAPFIGPITSAPLDLGHAERLRGALLRGRFVARWSPDGSKVGAATPVDCSHIPPFEQSEKPVARVVVDVMLKPEILDPQGQAVQSALARLGVTGVTSVRQGKRFEIEIDGAADTDKLDDMASTLLANTVIEDYTVRVEDA